MSRQIHLWLQTTILPSDGEHNHINTVSLPGLASDLMEPGVEKYSSGPRQSCVIITGLHRCFHPVSTRAYCGKASHHVFKALKQAPRTSSALRTVSMHLPKSLKPQFVIPQRSNPLFNSPAHSFLDSHFGQCVCNPAIESRCVLS